MRHLKQTAQRTKVKVRVWIGVGIKKLNVCWHISFISTYKYLKNDNAQICDTFSWANIHLYIVMLNCESLKVCACVSECLTSGVRWTCSDRLWLTLSISWYLCFSSANFLRFAETLCSASLRRRSSSTFCLAVSMLQGVRCQRGNWDFFVLFFRHKAYQKTYAGFSKNLAPSLVPDQV